MPEILEVEVYRRLSEEAVGREIASIVVADPHCLTRQTPRGLRSALVGRRFVAARRIGKLMVLDTDGPSVGMRFGMTGGLVLDDRAAIDRLLYSAGRYSDQWVRCVFGFKDGGALSFHDPRRFGRVELGPDESVLGPDALTLTKAQLRRALAAGRPPGPALKARLLDQSAIAGIGNLLADEILWRAGLSPTRPSGALDDQELARLHRTITTTLRQLGTRGGSHTGDLMAERHPGGHCPKDGVELVGAAVGGRTTWWCPHHQG